MLCWYNVFLLHHISLCRFAIHTWGSSNNRRKFLLDLRLYAVTDPDCNRRNSRSNAQAVRLALEGGATIVQLREKSAGGNHFCQEAEAVLAVTRQKGVGLTQSPIQTSLYKNLRLPPSCLPSTKKGTEELLLEI